MSAGTLSQIGQRSAIAGGRQRSSRLTGQDSPATGRRVVVCDRRGTPIRATDLFEAHRGRGILHRAFSVFVFRLAGTELLLQQRSRHKPLFPLRWANTCCSHPFPAEASVVQTAERRLYQEFGFSVGLREAGAFVYRAKDPEADFSEYEHDSVLIGAVDGPIELNPDRAEIAAWQWMAV